MSSQLSDEPVDADRWLYVHEDELIGAARVAAIDLVVDAGLHPHVAHFRGQAPTPDLLDAGRIRLVIGDDDKVRSARWG